MDRWMERVGKGRTHPSSPRQGSKPKARSSSHAIEIERTDRRGARSVGHRRRKDAEETRSSSVQGEGGGRRVDPRPWDRHPGVVGVDGPSLGWNGIGRMQDDVSPRWNGDEAWTCDQGQPGTHPNRTRSPAKGAKTRRTQ